MSRILLSSQQGISLSRRRFVKGLAAGNNWGQRTIVSNILNTLSRM